MLIFNRISYKNFLSTGNVPVEIQLDRDPSTLIVGPNGSGKSTLADALSLALFGRPYRDINKNQLVNSINGKNLEVVVEFTSGINKYKVVRGIKPTIFEIYHNGNLINQESHSRDYQKVLENNILKLNYKSFHQVVVLGSSSFVPFMQLPTYQRRAVIEDLLDIVIFTRMNQVLKDKVSKNKTILNDADNQCKSLREQIRLQSKHLLDLRAIDSHQEKQYLEDIKEIEDQIAELDSKTTDLLQRYEAGYQILTTKIGSVKSRRDKLITYEKQIDESLLKIKREGKFYELNDACPTCHQGIPFALKETKHKECSTKATELEEGIQKIYGAISAVNDELSAFDVETAAFNDMRAEARSNSTLKASLESRKSTLSAQLMKKSLSTDTASAEESLRDLNDTLEVAERTRGEHSNLRAYHEALSELLKDSGIKTKVIRQYLPVMNKLINQYLSTLEFFVLFNLDEEFNETIRSRHRDDFTYSSFSEGEKQRIDLALLFAWRQIARMKNSANTNLLILDETFDSSLDADGVDNLLKILASLEKDTNIFVISHKQDMLEGKFPTKIEFEKVHNFSRVKS